jgi:hypothetical protein
MGPRTVKVSILNESDFILFFHICFFLIDKTIWNSTQVEVKFLDLHSINYEKLKNKIK